MTPSFRLFTLLPAILIASFAPSLAATDNDLARAYRVIASKRFVDLTHSFDPRSPVWSGFGQAKMTPAADPKTQRPYTIQEDGIRTTLYEFVGQYGTHVDPPAHFDENPQPTRRHSAPTPSKKTASAQRSTSSSASTAPTSIRPRISTKKGSPWMRSPSNR